MAATIPARLHVILARESKLGVIFRRGPSKSVCTILWNRKDNTFSVGQWLRGRIYERRADLSPSGKHLIYFAMNGRWKSETKGSWTAISRTPYLKAISLYAKGDCWNGGGLFTGEKQYWLNDGYGHQAMKVSTGLRRDMGFKPATYFGGECTGVYYLRLLRDGWRLHAHEELGHWHDADIFEKTIKGGWLLRKICHGQVGAKAGHGVYWDEHRIVNPAEGREIDGSDWEWSDVEGDQIYWAAARGKLHSCRFRKEEMHDVRQLHDFNQMKFEALPAPY